MNIAAHITLKIYEIKQLNKQHKTVAKTAKELYTITKLLQSRKLRCFV